MRLARIPAPHPDRRYRSADHVLSARHGDRTVLLDRRSDRYFGLDETGSFIWALADDGARFADIVRRLRESYEVDETVATRDCARLLGELASLRLVVER